MFERVMVVVVVVVAVEGEDGGLRGGQGFLVVFILVDYQAIWNFSFSVFVESVSLAECSCVYV